MSNSKEKVHKVKEMQWLAEYIRNGCNNAAAARTVGLSPGTTTGWIRSRREESVKPYLWDLYMNGVKSMETTLNITNERIEQEYAKIAFFDPGNLFNADGSVKAITELDEDTRRAIAGLDVVTNRDLERILKVKISDKKAALDSLARIRGMFNDSLNVKHTFSELLAEIEDETGSEPLVAAEREKIEDLEEDDG